MLERGLVESRTDRPLPRAHFTPAGFDALRTMARDRRLLDPVRQELGLNAQGASADVDASGPAA